MFISTSIHFEYIVAPSGIYLIEKIMEKFFNGVYVMSQRQIDKIRDKFEVFTLVTIFLVSVIAITPGT